MTNWLQQHPWVTFIIIYALLTFIYNKVFRVRKLPILKDMLIYLLIAVGSMLLLFFQIRVGLPIVPSMAVAVALMLIVKVRMMITEKFQQNSK